MNRKLNTKQSLEQFDALVFKELKSMQRQGKTFARAGEIARKLHCNYVQALVAMERVKHRL